MGRLSVVGKSVIVFLLYLTVGGLLGCQNTALKPPENIEIHSVKSYLMQGQQAYLEKNWASAIKSFEKALVLDEHSLPAMYKLGNIAYRQKKLPVARGYYEKVLARDPGYNMAQYNLAVVNLALAEKHFKYYTAMLNVDADVSKVSDLLGHIYRFSTGGSSRYDKSSSLERLAERLQDNWEEK